MNNEPTDRLASVEAENARLRGEIASLRNILMGMLEDHLISRPDVVDRVIGQTEGNIRKAFLAAQSSDSKIEHLRKIGLVRGYRAFLSLLRKYIAKWDSVHH